MRVEIDIPDAEWWALGKAAEQQGKRISDLLMDAYRNRQKVDTFTVTVTALAGRGMSSRMIAEILGATVEQVGNAKRRAKRREAA